MAKKNGNGHGAIAGGEILVKILDELKRQSSGQDEMRKEMKRQSEELKRQSEEIRTGFRAMTKALTRRDRRGEETDAEVSELRTRVEQLEAAVFQEREQ